MKFINGVLNLGRVKNDGTIEMEKIGEVKEVTVEEEWIWVEGYKGTDKDMKCRDYQYELGKRFDMPDDAEIEECQSGFHLCLHLSEVYKFYTIEKRNRFFKVRALVRKKDYDAYGMNITYAHAFFCDPDSKLVAKSIEFISECSIDEILDADTRHDYSDWTLDEKERAINISLCEGFRLHRTNHLTSLGYSEPFAYYVAGDKDMYDRAVAIAEENVSLDIRILFICKSYD